MLSTFWQVWIMAIVFGSMAGCGVLIVYSMRGHRKEETTQTTGLVDVQVTGSPSTFTVRKPSKLPRPYRPT